VRYGVLADIHGNLHALEATLRVLSRESVDGYLCAGDLVGYGPFPNECVARISELGAVCVAGNHDLMAIDRLSEDRCIPLARETIRWTRGVLDGEARRYLGELPPRATVSGVAIAHGSLEDSTYYVLSAQQAAREAERLSVVEPGAEMLILGHTHRHYLFEPATRRLQAPRQASVSLAQRGDHALVMNPGSVGQARERRPRARFAVLDLERREVVFHAVDYDFEGCRRALEERGLPAAACHLPPSAWQVTRGLLRSGRDNVLARTR
jgi:predicted phosphodiesterase